MTIALVTASYGGYDPLRKVKPVPEVDCLAFTDDSTLKVKGWEVIVDRDPRRRRMHPRLAAKWAKFARPRVLDAYAAVVWVDAAYEVLDATEALAYDYFRAYRALALHRHPLRDNIYDEAIASRHLPKYVDEPVQDQIDAYRAEGFKGRNLYATGILCWNRTMEARRLGAAWWRECVRWSYQDQLSLPVVLRRAGVVPITMPGSVYDPGWLRHWGHRSDR